MPPSYCRLRTNQMLHTDIGDQPILHVTAPERSTVSHHCRGCRVARCDWWTGLILSDPRLGRCRVLSDAPPVSTYLPFSLSRLGFRVQYLHQEVNDNLVQRLMVISESPYTTHPRHLDGIGGHHMPEH
jgi:hypothetical protein